MKIGFLNENLIIDIIPQAAAKIHSYFENECKLNILMITAKVMFSKQLRTWP